jgi:hypothetical protein
LITADAVHRFQHDPVRFIRTVLGAKLWRKQREIARSVVVNRTTAVRSCHGSGKTFLAARIALWYLLTRPYSNVITTAPTARQVTKLLWKEVRNAIRDSNKAWPHGLGGNLLPKANDFQLDGESWMMTGFSTDDPDNFQGYHAPGGVLVILDEAPGVHARIWEAIQGVLTGPNDRMLAIGNPTTAGGDFYDLFHKNAGPGCFHISAYDVPNVKLGRTVVPGLVSSEWVEERKKKWGEGSPMWQSRVLGQFPAVDDYALVPLNWIELANQYWAELEEDGGWSGRIVDAIDVARFGDDSTVRSRSRDQGVQLIERWPKQSTMKTANRAGLLFAPNGREATEEIRIDADGLGAGVFDRLCEQYGKMADDDDKAAAWAKEGKVRGMRGGKKPIIDPEARFLNRRAEWYWTARERLDPETELERAALPPDPELQGQLTTIRWEPRGDGKIKIESKDDMRKRGLKSPDAGDSVVYSLAKMPDRMTASRRTRALVKM